MWLERFYSVNYDMAMRTKARKRLMHITLNEEVIENEALRERTVARIQTTTGFTPSNSKRLERYGVLSGLVDEDKREELRRVEGVASVEEDSIKRSS